MNAETTFTFSTVVVRFKGRPPVLNVQGVDLAVPAEVQPGDRVWWRVEGGVVVDCWVAKLDGEVYGDPSGKIARDDTQEAQ